MLPAAVLSLAAAATTPRALKRDECNQDNCLRDIQGTRDGLLPITLRQSDCSSFMGITVTTASTTTLTLSVWETPDCGPTPSSPNPPPPSPTAAPNRRQNTAVPTNPVPTYATFCTDSSEYFSACSCWDIFPSTTTAPGSIATATVTVTLTKDWCDC